MKTLRQVLSKRHFAARERVTRAGIGRGRRRGVAFLEFAFVMPILLALLLNMVQYGLLAQATEIVTNLSREGARFASQGAGTPDSRTIDYLKGEIALTPLASKNSGDPAQDFTITITPSDSSSPMRVAGDPITVTVTYNLSSRLFVPLTRWMVAKYQKDANSPPLYTTAAVMRILSQAATPPSIPAATPVPTQPPSPPPPAPTSPPAPTATSAPTAIPPTPAPTATSAPTAIPPTPAPSPPTPLPGS